MKCVECCSWDAPLNVPPIGMLDGKRVKIEGAQVLMRFEQHLIYHYHVVLHQELNLLGLPT